MTVEEKRNKVNKYCDDTTCSNCLLTKTFCGDNGEMCLNIELASEEELNEALEIINDFKNPIKPNYYNDTKIAPIDVIEDWDLDFCLGSALKYIKRAGKKENNPSVQDLKKVIWYIERRIRELEEVE